MKCPMCGNLETRVVDSRIVEEGKSIKRRRECETCKNRFTTFERLFFNDFFVIKKDGTKEIYDKAKIKNALMLSFAKRTAGVAKIEEIISSLEQKWISTGKEIPSAQIGDDILSRLKEEDFVAYIRFASVYKEFKDIDDFRNFL